MDQQTICRNIIGTAEIQYNQNSRIAFGLSSGGLYQWAFCAM